jgi:hypothetical protein
VADGFRLTHTTHSKIRIKTEAKHAIPREYMTNGHDTEANAVPAAVHKNGQAHPPTRRRGCRAQFYTQAFWKISASSECGGFYRDPALDAIFASSNPYTSHGYNFVNNGGDMCEENVYLEKEKEKEAKPHDFGCSSSCRHSD